MTDIYLELGAKKVIAWSLERQLRGPAHGVARGRPPVGD
jgi:hypothetical protein